MKKMGEHKKLGEILVDLQVLRPHDVERVLEAQRRRTDRQKIGEVARNMGLVTEEQILAALAVQMEMFPGIKDWGLNEILNCLMNYDGSKSEEPPGGFSTSCAPCLTQNSR
jgi:hypothetical protein